MKNVTCQVSTYIKSKGIAITTISKATGIAYSCLSDSLSGNGRKRQLRADEYLAICVFLEKNPFEFYKTNSEQTNKVS